jgi:hypothetical protein
MFPALAQSTGELPIPPALAPPSPDRLAMMPRRKQTREQTAATASTKNADNAPNSSPNKNANAKPGSPPPTNPTLLRPSADSPATSRLDAALLAGLICTTWPMSC